LAGIKGVVSTRFGIWLYVPCGWKKERLEVIRRRHEEYHATLLYEIDWLAESLPETAKHFLRQRLV
jgi:hypothetical protein